MNNLQQIAKAFEQFSRDFNGDPKKQVEELVASGKISQRDLIKIQNDANSLMHMLRQMGMRI